MVYELDAGLKPIPNEFFVAAHGNSIRAIVKFSEDTAGDVITGLEILSGTPLVYGLESDLRRQGHASDEGHGLRKTQVKVMPAVRQ